MLHADSAQNRLVGIGLVSAAYVLFTLLDGSAKWLVGSMPVIMVVWLRFVMHALIASAVLLPVRGAELVKSRYWRWHAVRAYLHELDGDLPAAATAYAEAARRATNIAERDHLVRQAARARALASTA